METVQVKILKAKCQNCLPVSSFEASFNNCTPMEALKSSMHKMQGDANLLSIILEIMQDYETPDKVLLERLLSDSLPLLQSMYDRIDGFYYNKQCTQCHCYFLPERRT